MHKLVNKIVIACCLLVGISAGVLISWAQSQQQQPSRSLKVGARNSSVRNIGAFIVDSAITLPKRQSSDTLHSQKLRQKGVFFYDTTDKKLYWYDGQHFRYLVEDNIYKSDGKIANHRQVDLAHKNLYFKDGRVFVDTLLLAKNIKGLSTDSFLTRFKDTVRYITADSLPNIYNKNGSIKEDRIATITTGKKLQLKGGRTIIDSLILGKVGDGKHNDSLLVIQKDTIKRIHRDSSTNIYTKNGSIKENRTANISTGKILKIKGGKTEIDSLIIRKRVTGYSTDSFLTVLNDTIRRIPNDSLPTIYKKNGEIKQVRQVTFKGGARLAFTGGRVELDTLFLPKLKISTTDDSVLTIFKDSVRKRKLSDLVNAGKNIYNTDDSIKSKRTVTLADKNKPGQILHFIQGAVHIDTLLLKNGKKGNSFDSLLIVRNDSVYRIGRDSVFNIYNKNGEIKQVRKVTFKDKARIAFTGGRVELDTLFLKHLKQGDNEDSLLTIKNDTVRKIKLDVKQLTSIYTKDDSIKNNRTVTLAPAKNKTGIKLHFTKGSVHIDTLLVKARQGFSTDSFLTRYKDTVRYITADSMPNIYNKNGTIKEKRIVKIEGNKKGSLSFQQGRVEIDTLLVRKRKLGLSTDTFLVAFNDTVRYIPADSLWNIYTRDGKLINTVSDKRTVDLDGKNLIFQGKTSNNNNQNAGKVGVLQTTPLYTLDIATHSFMKSQTSNNINADSVAVRISHNVEENKLGYGLLLNEKSNKANGRSAIGFEGGHENTIFKKAAIWAQNGSNFKRALFGINTADSNKRLQERIFINHEGNILIGNKSNQLSESLPARLVVNNSSWTHGNINEIYTSDMNSYNRKNVGILVNVGGDASAFKYGLVMREAAYNSASKVGIGFYNGGYSGSQPHAMASRIWSTTGNGANNPLFGIDVSTYLNGGKVAHLYTRMVINQSGNVGMGTENPSTNLHIRREGNYNNYIRVEAGSNGNNGTATYSGLMLTENNSYGWLVRNNTQSDNLELGYSINAAGGNMDNGGKAGILISKANYVGINTRNTPTARLDVYGNVKIHSVAVGSSDNDSILVIKNSEVKKIAPLSKTPYNIYWRDDSLRGDRNVDMHGRSLTFKAAGANKYFTLKNDGHHNLLKIEGGSTSDANKQSGIWLTEQNNTYGWQIMNDVASDRLQISTSGGSNSTPAKKIEIDRSGLLMIYDNNVNSDANGRNNTNQSGSAQLPSNQGNSNSGIAFISDNYNTGQNGNNRTYGFLMKRHEDALQLYNIGTNPTPSEKLFQIRSNGITSLYGSNGAGPILEFRDSHNGDGNKTALYFGIRRGRENGQHAPQLTFTIHDDGNNSNGGVDRIRNRMVITERIVAVGNNLVPNSSGGNKYNSVNGNGSGQNDIQFFVEGAISVANVTNRSDSRLKTKVRPIASALENVLKLRPVTYYWKDTSTKHGFSSRRQFGFLAQEVQNIFPELVTVEDFNFRNDSLPTFSLNYIGIIPQVVSALQELHKKQELQASEIQQLRQRLQNAKVVAQEAKSELDLPEVGDRKEEQIRELKNQVQELQDRLQKLEQLLLKATENKVEKVAGDAEAKPATAPDLPVSPL